MFSELHLPQLEEEIGELEHFSREERLENSQTLVKSFVACGGAALALNEHLKAVIDDALYTPPLGGSQTIALARRPGFAIFLAQISGTKDTGRPDFFTSLTGDHVLCVASSGTLRIERYRQQDDNVADVLDPLHTLAPQTDLV